MRTIVALFICTIATAQPPSGQIERLEQRIAAKPDSVPDRVALLANLTNRAVPLEPEKVREARRSNILWLIEHHPEAKIYADPQLLLPLGGRLADPSGSAQAVELWKEIAAKPHANVEVIANAAIYLQALDLSAALALLDAHPDDPALSRARGTVDAAAVIGISGLGQGVQFATTAPLRATPEAKAARREIDASANSYLLGSAGVVFASVLTRIEIPFDLTFGDDDSFELAERWLRRAIELAPPGDEWKPALGQTLSNKASRTIDPHEKVRLFEEADALVAESAKTNVLVNLVIAEFDADDDAASARDAQHLLEIAPRNAYVYNVAQTMLGRIAAAKGNLNEAKTRLIASVTMPAAIKNAVLQPNLTLAQDLYEAGDRETVVEFLEASRSVWKFDAGRIDSLVRVVKSKNTAVSDLLSLSRRPPGLEMLNRPAPAFDGEDLDGKTWTREQLAGKVIALEFGNVPLAEKVWKDFSARGAVLLRIRDNDTKRRFEVITNPTLVMINRQGNVSAFRPGLAGEFELRNDFETSLGGTQGPFSVSVPRQIEMGASVGGKVTLAWEPVDNAESYVVEWDSRDEKGWIFDQDHTVRVIPTRDTSTTLDLTGFTRVRWRVYAVPPFGQPGSSSAWLEIENVPVTKIYK